MMIRTLTFAALVAATALPAAAQTIGGSGQSQSQQSQPQSQSLGGPLIPGVCLAVA